MKTNYIFRSALIVLLSVFLSFQSKGQTVIDGIAYNIINDGTAVEVAPLPKNNDTDVRYTAATLIIPASVVINGTNYPVKKIGANSMRENPNLISITIPEGVEVIGNSSFAQCPLLPSVVLPSTIKSIEDWAFYGCPALETINIPDGVTAITEHTFQQTGLKSIVLPSSVTSLKVCAFQDAHSLASINLENIREIVAWSLYGTAITSATVSDVPNIGSCAFAKCPNLETVVLNNVMSIGDWVFQDCPKLRSVKFTGTEAIGTGTFSGCSSLTSITIPKSVVSVGDWSLEKTGIKEIFASWEVPDDEVYFSENAFGSDAGKINFTWKVPASVKENWGDEWLGYPVEIDNSNGVNIINLESSKVLYKSGLLNLINMDGYSVNIINIDGRSLFDFQVKGNNFQKSLTLNNGIYIIRATNGSIHGSLKFLVK